jgi:uncharacterized repeat protein (TIGR03803 family)
MRTQISDPFGWPFATLARTFNRRRPRELRQKAVLTLFAPVLLVGLGLLPACWVTAQTLTSMPYLFYCGGPSVLLLSGNILYGTGCDSAGDRSLFAVRTDSTGFTNLHIFPPPTTNSSGIYTNSDGLGPAGLILTGSTLYGVAVGGGSFGNGTLFKLNMDGTAFTNLYSFSGFSGYYTNSGASFGTGTNTDGASPSASLTLSTNNLYLIGTTERGGMFAQGTVFKVNTDGTGFAVLHSFTPLSNGDFGTNSDGANPHTALVLSGNTVYGTTAEGGEWGSGVVFAVNADGTGFTNLHSFISHGSSYSVSGLVLSGNTLYGTRGYVDPFFYAGGEVFSMKTDGTAFKTLCSLGGLASPSFPETGIVLSGLVISGNTLYGAEYDTSIICRTCNPILYSTGGRVFAVNTDGSGSTTLYQSWDFSPAELTLSGTTLYGRTAIYSNGGYGYAPARLFSISFAPPLTINPSTSNIILSWPTNYAGFDYAGYSLQSSTNLGPSAVWATNSPAPVVIGNQNVIITPLSGPQRFYRLVH